MKVITYSIIACMLSGVLSFAQSVTIQAGSTTANQNVSGKLSVKRGLELERDGQVFSDGSQQRTANTLSPFPARSFLLPIYARFSDVGISGESEITGFLDYVELHAANFDFEKNANNMVTVGPRIFRPFVIKKGLDRATTGLIGAFENGRIINNVVIIIRQQPRQPNYEIINRFRYTLRNVTVLDLRHMERLNTEGSFFIEEEVRLSYSSITIEDLLYNRTEIISGL